MNPQGTKITLGAPEGICLWGHMPSSESLRNHGEWQSFQKTGEMIKMWFSKLGSYRTTVPPFPNLNSFTHPYKSNLVVFALDPKYKSEASLICDGVSSLCHIWFQGVCRFNFSLLWMELSHGTCCFWWVRRLWAGQSRPPPLAVTSVPNTRGHQL